MPVDMEKYIKVSDEIMVTLRKFADKFEQDSIDEAFLDVSKSAKEFADAEKIAVRIKTIVKEKHGLTCSIGVAANKLVAKIASDFIKPDGLTLVRPEDVGAFLRPLDVRKLPGVGPKTEVRLSHIGIKTIGELAAAKSEELATIFGIRGPRLIAEARGIDEDEVEESWEIKSIGRQITFEQDTEDERSILATLDALAEEAYSDLITQSFFFRTVSIVVRYKGFETHTAAKTLRTPTAQLSTIKERARELIRPFLGIRPIRLVGVRLSGLVADYRQTQLSTGREIEN